MNLTYKENKAFANRDKKLIFRDTILSDAYLIEIVDSYENTKTKIFYMSNKDAVHLASKIMNFETDKLLRKK